MWLGEQITERGIGNGISLIIFAGIVVGLPTAIVDTVQQRRRPARSRSLDGAGAGRVHGGGGRLHRLHGTGQRRIPVQYAKRVVGAQDLRRPEHLSAAARQHRRRDPGDLRQLGDHDPADARLVLSRVEARGAAIADQLQLGAADLLPASRGRRSSSSATSTSSIIFNPVDMADNMRKYGGFIPGIRPGKRTAEYIDRSSPASPWWCALPGRGRRPARVPVHRLQGRGIPASARRSTPRCRPWFTQGLGISFYFGGTSLLIVIGVAMDTVQQVESQLVMRTTRAS